MSSEPTVLNYMPLVVSSEFGKSAQFIIPVKTISIYILKRKSFATVLHGMFYSVWSMLGYLLRYNHILVPAQ